MSFLCMCDGRVAAAFAVVLPPKCGVSKSFKTRIFSVAPARRQTGVIDLTLNCVTDLLYAQQ